MRRGAREDLRYLLALRLEFRVESGVLKVVHAWMVGCIEPKP